MTANQPKRSVALENTEVPTGTISVDSNGSVVANPFVLPIAIILSVLVCDQLSKMWAVSTLANQPPMQVISDFVRFTLVYNFGGAMGTSFGPSHYYLVTALVILPLLFFYLYQSRFHKLVTIPLSFIAGGALGNVIDRVRIGKVVDFIDVDFFDLNLFGYQLDRWWTFNIADAAITCSIVFILITMFLPHRWLQKAPKVVAALSPADTNVESR